MKAVVELVWKIKKLLYALSTKNITELRLTPRKNMAGTVLEIDGHAALPEKHGLVLLADANVLVVETQRDGGFG